MGCLLKKETIVDVSNQLRANGKKVILTHGAFDLFHIGHAELLKRSKKMGDYLIVGVDTDNRIKEYKKVTRPVIPLEQRTEILLENKSIDFVFYIKDEEPINDPSFMELYALMFPNIVTCGFSFPFLNDFKSRSKYLRGIDAIPISHQYDNFQSTTKIIDKIRQY